MNPEKYFALECTKCGIPMVFYDTDDPDKTLAQCQLCKAEVYIVPVESPVVESQ